MAKVTAGRGEGGLSDRYGWGVTRTGSICMARCRGQRRRKGGRRKRKEAKKVTRSVCNSKEGRRQKEIRRKGTEGIWKNTSERGQRREGTEEEGNAKRGKR